MILPILDHAERDVILIMHSYSGVPGSAAARGLGKSERTAAGKKTSVIGQIFITAMLIKGGDGTTILSALGGEYPAAITPDVNKSLFPSSLNINQPTDQDKSPPLLHTHPRTLSPRSNYPSTICCRLSHSSRPHFFQLPLSNCILGRYRFQRKSCVCEDVE